MERRIVDKTFDEERALYHLQDTEVENCIFKGPSDGESVLKEARNIRVVNCQFSLRYPCWHVRQFQLIQSNLDDHTRAPIWYASEGLIQDTYIEGVKCLRECEDISIQGSTIHSPEFGWKCQKISIQDTEIESEYLLFESRDIKIDHLNMKGKYSFQYIKNMTIANSYLDTKDAFWHSEQVTVTNSVLKGEYLGWFSEGLTLINCRIIGTQPFCYCKMLRLVNCTMEETDLAFEYSEVDADICGHVLSIKNPRAGLIRADSVGEIIREDSIMDLNAQIIVKK